MLLYDYPGNIRELENLIHQAVLLTRGPLLCLNDFPPTLGQSTSPGAEPQLRELLSMPLDQATRALERILITRAIVRSQGNKSEAARELGIHRQHLYTKLKEYRIE